jgi:hypothetical protein
MVISTQRVVAYFSATNQYFLGALRLPALEGPAVHRAQ